VNLGARFGDRHHIHPIPGHVSRHVCDDGEGGDDFQPILRLRGQRRKAKGHSQNKGKAEQEHGTILSHMTTKCK
jgi:hypothetical protein